MAIHKPFDPEFLNRLETRAVEGWQSIVWRAVLGATNPLRPNSRGARWNPPNEEALYCSLTEECAVAELESLIERQPVPIRTERRLFRLTVRLSRVLDLSEVEMLHQFAAEAEDFLGEDHTPAQRLGRAAAFLGCGGLLVPSARCAGTNAVILVNRLSVEEGDAVDVMVSSVS